MQESLVQQQQQKALLVGALFTLLCITIHLTLVLIGQDKLSNWPLWMALSVVGTPMLLVLARKAFRLEFESDLLAGIAVATGVVLGEYLAASIVILMLTGGNALESFAMRKAAYALQALAKRMPLTATRRKGSIQEQIQISEVGVGDELIILPHQICPVDGIVIEGHSTMDESFLTGEPYQISKTKGTAVLSGAVNSSGMLVIRASAQAKDSRYAKIMRVMDQSQQRRPKMRRLGDQLGALYTPIALAVATGAWIASGDPIRFLAVLVVATPCPLLIGIPVAIIGAISLAARRSIIIRDPVALERSPLCSTAIFDKTGTLTYGEPALTEVVIFNNSWEEQALVRLVASAQSYSKHPLAKAFIDRAKHDGTSLQAVTLFEEPPGAGLRAVVEGHELIVTGRKRLSPPEQAKLPPQAGGLECVVLIDGVLTALCRFRDEARKDGRNFIAHLTKRHHLKKIILLSGDREEEASHLAAELGIKEVLAGKSPEEKVEIVRRENALAPAMFVGDGINDAPALFEATVGVAFGSRSDVTAEASSVVILEPTLQRVDEFIHISQRLRRIALQSAAGGIALSLIGMALAGFGYLTPVAGAVIQEFIDLGAVLNALRVGRAPNHKLLDFEQS